MKTFFLTTGCVMALAFSACGHEETVKLEDLPPAVRETITKQAEGATVEEIEKETKNGKVVYEVEVKKDGKEREFLISSEGEYLGDEKEEKKD